MPSHSSLSSLLLPFLQISVGPVKVNKVKITWKRLRKSLQGRTGSGAEKERGELMRIMKWAVGSLYQSPALTRWPQIDSGPGWLANVKTGGTWWENNSALHCRLHCGRRQDLSQWFFSPPSPSPSPSDQYFLSANFICFSLKSSLARGRRQPQGVAGCPKAVEKWELVVMCQLWLTGTLSAGKYHFPPTVMSVLANIGKIQPE